MRVPTLHTSQLSFSGVESRQAELARLQGQLSTGLRVNSPGDDPVAAAQAELARSRLARVAQEQRSVQLAGSLMSAAEGALTQGVNLLQSVRESLVAAGNAGYSAQDRQALALQLRSARDSLLALANTRDGAGGHVFAGQGSAAGPLQGGSVPDFRAVAGEQRIGQDGRFAATVDGRATFFNLPQGNGVFVTASAAGNTGTGWIDVGVVSAPNELTGLPYRIETTGTAGALGYVVQEDGASMPSQGGAWPPDGVVEVKGQRVIIAGVPAPGDQFDLTSATPQSIFTTLEHAISTLEGSAGAPLYAEGLMRAQASLDHALDGMILTRSRVGEELRRVDDAAATGEDQALLLTTRRSGLEDLDYAQAISQLQANQFALEAALKSYASIGRTSLFQLLG